MTLIDLLEIIDNTFIAIYFKNKFVYSGCSKKIEHIHKPYLKKQVKRIEITKNDGTASRIYIE